MRTPFYVLSTPSFVMHPSYSVFLYEGLFAYCNDYFLGCNLKVPLSSIQITKTSVNWFNKVKVKITIYDEASKNDKTIIMRASLSNFNLFKQFLDEKVDNDIRYAKV